MSTKAVLVLLGVFGLLFFGAIVLGLGGCDERNLTEEQERTGWLRDVLLDDERTKLDLAHIHRMSGDSGAIDSPEVSLPAGAVVQLRVVASDERMSLRRMGLTHQRGPTVEVHWEPAADEDGQRSPTVEFKLEAEGGRRTQELMVESPGGVLTLRGVGDLAPAAIRIGK
jgi:hypothetical protein